MADLTDLQAAQTIKIAGASSTGIESTYALVDSNGSLHGTIRDAVSGAGVTTTQTQNATKRALDIGLVDGPQVDSYQRIRTVSPHSVFAIFNSNGLNSLYFNTATVGSGSIAFNSNQASARLSTTTGATDSIIIQTKRYLRYTPGYSYMLILAGVIGSPKTNVTQRWGYFDTNNGVFFEQTSAGLVLKMRSNTSGSPVDVAVTQANFNLDKLNGTGASGVTLDTSKYNAYVLDYVWQGAGRVRVGLLYNDTIIYCHQFLNSNVNTVPYWRSPSRPGRVELVNTGVTASPTNMDITCFTALKESLGEILATYNFSASSGVTEKSINSTTPLPAISIRPKLTFNGITNRVPIKPTEFEILSVQDALYLQVLLNPTLTGASFTSAGTASAAEYDITATAVTGGTKIWEGYVSGGGKGVSGFASFGDHVLLGLDIAGSVQDVLTFAAAKINGNSNSLFAARWDEYQ